MRPTDTGLRPPPRGGREAAPRRPRVARQGSRNAPVRQPPARPENPRHATGNGTETNCGDSQRPERPRPRGKRMGGGGRWAGSFVSLLLLNEFKYKIRGCFCLRAIFRPVPGASRDRRHSREHGTLGSTAFPGARHSRERGIPGSAAFPGARHSRERGHPARGGRQALHGPRGREACAPGKPTVPA